MATTITVRRTASGTSLRPALKSIGTWFGDCIRAMQYARLVQCMSELSDEQLKEIGMTRSQIIRDARISIYGE